MMDVIAWCARFAVLLLVLMVGVLVGQRSVTAQHSGLPEQPRIVVGRYEMNGFGWVVPCVASDDQWVCGWSEAVVPDAPSVSHVVDNPVTSGLDR